jgi:hypothetical protein
MGQRHQIYMAVKERKGFDKKAGKTIRSGIHHQWLFGKGASFKVAEVMEYQKKAVEFDYHPLNGTGIWNGDEPTECLHALYLLDGEGGFSSSVSRLGEWEKKQCERPDTGDNNDGITIYDFRDPKNPKYCMMNIGDQVLNDEDYRGSVSTLPSLEPVSAEDYVRAYYPVERTKHQEDTYNKKVWAKIQTQVKGIIKRTAPFKVMTLDECKKLFPKMYRKAEEQEALKKAGVDLTQPISRAKIKQILSEAKS